MAYNNTRTAARSNNNSGFDRSKGAGFRMSGKIKEIVDGETKDRRASAKVTLDKITSVNGSVLSQTVAMAFGDNVDYIAPQSAKIGDTAEFFGIIDGGTVLVLGPWTDSSYDKKPASRGRQQARGQARGRSRR